MAISASAIICEFQRYFFNKDIQELLPYGKRMDDEPIEKSIKGGTSGVIFM